MRKCVKIVLNFICNDNYDSQNKLHLNFVTKMLVLFCLRLEQIIVEIIDAFFVDSTIWIFNKYSRLFKVIFPILCVTECHCSYSYYYIPKKSTQFTSEFPTILIIFLGEINARGFFVFDFQEQKAKSLSFAPFRFLSKIP